MSEETPTYGAGSGGPSARERALRLADACERNASDYGQQWEGHAAEMVAALALGNLAIADELAGIRQHLHRLAVGREYRQASRVVQGRDAELARLALEGAAFWDFVRKVANDVRDWPEVKRAEQDARDRRDDGEAAQDADGFPPTREQWKAAMVCVAFARRRRFDGLYLNEVVEPLAAFDAATRAREGK